MLLFVASLGCVLAAERNPHYHEGSRERYAIDEPPFWGTIFIDPDIITESDSSTFLGATYTGRGMRTMFDRRVNSWITVEAFLFYANFIDGLYAEIQVNPEFTSPESATIEAVKFGWVIGQLPTALRADLETVWIHEGTEPFGGGNNNILIHTGQALLYENDGILEETLIHEACHTSLDAHHAASPGWMEAQLADSTFISSYAQDYPDREDIAESFLPYVAIRYKEDRISEDLASTILETTPNRIAYFDSQALDLYQYVDPVASHASPDLPHRFSISQNYPNPFNPTTTISYSLPEQATVRMTIFNVQGSEITTLFDARRPAGRYDLQWDGVNHAGSPVGTGVYFCRIEAGQFSETIKMVYLR